MEERKLRRRKNLSVIAAILMFVTVTEVGCGEQAAEESGARSEQKILSSDVEDKDIQSVLIAYQDYIDNHMIFSETDLERWKSNYGGICTLIYVNDDDLPECFYYEYSGMPRLLWYIDGQILASYVDSSNSDCSYQKETGRFCFVSRPGGNLIHTFAENSPDQNSMIVTGMAHTLTVLGGPDAEPYYAVMDDNSTKVDNLEDLTQVDQATYEEYINSFGDYINIFEQEILSPSVAEAYEVLLSNS